MTLRSKQCPVCNGWFFNFGSDPAHHHDPLWCVCAHPVVATDYGWEYCGRCQRGFEPVAVPS